MNNTPFPTWRDPVDRLTNIVILPTLSFWLLILMFAYIVSVDMIYTYDIQWNSYRFNKLLLKLKIPSDMENECRLSIISNGTLANSIPSQASK
jgi:hypothetical protein